MELKSVMALIDKVCEKENLHSIQIKEGEFSLTIKTKGKIKAEKNIKKSYVPSFYEEEVVESEDIVENKDIEKEKNVVAAVKEENKNIVKSPLVGTFYAAPSEDEAPFVKVGDVVKKGQVLGIVEAMKLMNEIESEYEGTVQEILATNEEMVEYGQSLFVIA